MMKFFSTGVIILITIFFIYINIYKEHLTFQEGEEPEIKSSLATQVRNNQININNLSTQMLGVSKSIDGIQSNLQNINNMINQLKDAVQTKK